jgi:hypothetical protein
VQFTTLPGKTYSLDVREGILGSWTPVGTTVLGNGLPAQLPDAGAGASDLKIYRVRY